MNEGWATFWHYTILQTLYEEGLVSDSFMLQVLHSHTNVLTQPGFDSPHYSGINPYALGFAMFRDIRRICECPTDEDKRWFPDWAGSDWLETLDFAMRNFKDESFIAQFFSPKLMRDFRFFHLLDDDQQATLRVQAIHNDEGYRDLRSTLARQYSLPDQEPNIQVSRVDVRGDRSLTLRHFRTDRRPLQSTYEQVMKHVASLWGFTVRLETVSEDGSISPLHECVVDNSKRTSHGAAMQRFW
jgi:stage V sporulation protein R